MCKSCSRVGASTILHVSRVSPWSFLVHNLRLLLDFFFVRFFCIVFDILGVSGCTFGTAVAPWGALGPPTRAPPWGDTWLFRPLERCPHSWDLLLTFFCFPGSILGYFWCQKASLVWFCHIVSNKIATTSRVHVLLQSLSNTASVHVLVVTFFESCFLVLDCSWLKAKPLILQRPCV